MPKKSPNRRNKKNRNRLWWYRIDIVVAVTLAERLLTIGWDFLRFLS